MCDALYARCLAFRCTRKRGHRGKYHKDRSVRACVIAWPLVRS